MGNLIEIRKVHDGVELVCEEERGFTKRRFIYSFVINKEQLKKIEEEMEKK